MPDKKHYIITSITLGAIAACSAALIGLTNLVTRDRIAENEKAKIASGISEIFGDNSKVLEESNIKQYVLSKKYYTLGDIYTVGEKDNDYVLGYAFKTTGSNSYGKISLIVGFDKTNLGFMGLSVIVNEQTYASTLVENYINPLNNEPEKLNDIDVKCGATYGATTVKDMINEAYSAAQEIWKE